MAEGFGEMALELQDREAAWLNLSVQPTNTILTIDGSPMAAIASRVPAQSRQAPDMRQQPRV